MYIFKEAWNRFWKEEDGLGTLEILLIVAVLLIIAIAFRKWIMKWMEQLFSSADSEINTETSNLRGAGNQLGGQTTP